MNTNVIFAIFRRNFVSYFSNPTGYVFICVFVLLIAFAAFWPNEFFNNNLANLDQLNKYLPLIMLVFIPAITMSIWAEERRQGTDELLLTIPATDFDVVIGKYLAAVAIFSVALVFSAIANLGVFTWSLGIPDYGLYFGTYIGYWMVGLAMLSIGMVASFLTGNLTVGFVLGVVFNAPLAFASSADVIMSPSLAREVRSWSIAEKFRDFGQGVISLVGVGYFLLIVAVMLYLSMVLIGRRHWMGGRDGHSMLGHYLVRALALVLLAVGFNLLFARVSLFNRARLDVSQAQLSSLSDQTEEMLKKLDPNFPVTIDAYISPEVPESYAQTRSNLLNVLREMDALGGEKVKLTIHDTEPLSDEASSADKQFGIKGQRVLSRSRGAMKDEEIYLGFACTSGTEKVVVPFIDRGVPVEYELIRGISTVNRRDAWLVLEEKSRKEVARFKANEQKQAEAKAKELTASEKTPHIAEKYKSRKSVGVLATDARMYGSFNQQTMGMSRNQMIIDELEKQYEVKEVRADSPITEKFDVLLAVQPSSLSPEQMTNFLAVVKGGQATAIFEDPFPILDQSVPGTAAPKQPPGGMNPMMMMQRQPPQPKGEITPLWNMLGVQFTGTEVIWQNYNPYPEVLTFPIEFVFTGPGAADKPYNDEAPATSNLRNMLFVFPGAIQRKQASDLEFTPLVHTGTATGTVKSDQIMMPSFFGQGGGLNPNRRQLPTHEAYILACHIKGKIKDDLQMQADKPADTGEAAAASADKNEKQLNVVLVADIDCLYSEFFNLRNRGQDEESDVNLNLDNVVFVLNVLDTLAGDERFVEIRKRHPAHATLTKFEENTKAERERVMKAREEFRKEFEEKKDKEQKKLDDEIAELQKRKDIDPGELIRRVDMVREARQKALLARTEQLERERDEQIKASEREFARDTREKQNAVKFAAVFWPPILPLLMGVAVFFNRRAREREGVSKARLR